MRAVWLSSLLTLACPAAAQAADRFPTPRGADSAIPRELADPAMPARLGRMAGALTRALMDIPVGELEAAIDGRPATPPDRSKTVANEVDHRGMDRDIERQVASSAGALQRSVPAVEQALGRAAAEIERAVRNLPDPDYPRR